MRPSSAMLICDAFAEAGGAGVNSFVAWSLMFPSCCAHALCDPSDTPRSFARIEYFPSPVTVDAVPQSCQVDWGRVFHEQIFIFAIVNSSAYVERINGGNIVMR